MAGAGTEMATAPLTKPPGNGNAIEKPAAKYNYPLVALVVAAVTFFVLSIVFFVLWLDIYIPNPNPNPIKQKSGFDDDSVDPELKAQFDARAAHGVPAISGLHVTKGFAARGYGAVRVSLVTDVHSVFAGSEGSVGEPVKFSYDRDFRYRWDNKQPEGGMHLKSVIKNLDPEKTSVLNVDGTEVHINLPGEGKATSGIFFADPCIRGPDLGSCHYKMWELNKTFPLLINAIMDESTNPGVHWWGIIGDNWYDQMGKKSMAFWDMLTLDVKSKIFMMVLGNHDFWYQGYPGSGTSKDQFGIGMMQFYAVDPLASSLVPNQSSGEFLDFSINPDVKKQWDLPNNHYTNLIWWNAIGNMGFLGFSGAVTQDDAEPKFIAACKWFGEHVNVNGSVHILGHWNVDTYGCKDGMSTPKVHSRLKYYPGCAKFWPGKFFYHVGHAHCNQIDGITKQKQTFGFMIGGAGMLRDVDCKGQFPHSFGFEYIKSNDDGTVEIWYIYIYEKLLFQTNVRRDAFVKCVNLCGIDECVHRKDPRGIPYGYQWFPFNEDNNNNNNNNNTNTNNNKKKCS